MQKGVKGKFQAYAMDVGEPKHSYPMAFVTFVCWCHHSASLVNVW